MTASARTAAGAARAPIVVYGAATLQGFAFTLVPALATVFAQAPYHIAAGAFGGLFVPLTLGAILAAVVTPVLAHRYGMVRVLGFGALANVLALLALLASLTIAGAGAYLLLLADTAALGVGFGLNFSAVNELAAGLRGPSTRNVTLANVLTGLGTALTPLLVAGLVVRGVWPLWPALLALLFIAVFALSLGWRSGAVAKRSAAPRPVRRALVWFGIAALLYAICEGVFSSWATTFTHIDRGFSLASGEAALAAFWFALTLTRLFAAFTSRMLSPQWAFVAFPAAIATAFLALPLWASAPLLIAGFALGGIACSIVFPYAMSLAFAAMPADEDRVAGVLVGALMIGEGMGTFAVGMLHGSGGVGLVTVYHSAAVVALALVVVALLAVRSTAKGKA
ncbi:MAG: MFS transporter [Vulcanimicrobiaceae bacterium]